jgi:hypothetical protein
MFAPGTINNHAYTNPGNLDDFGIDLTNLGTGGAIGGVAWWIDHPGAQMVDGGTVYTGGGGTIGAVYLVEAGQWVFNDGPNTIVGSLTVTNAFAVVTGSGNMFRPSGTATFTGGTVTGQRYSVKTGGSISGSVQGNLGPTYFPGSTNGFADAASSYDGFLQDLEVRGPSASFPGIYIRLLSGDNHPRALLALDGNDAAVLSFGSGGLFNSPDTSLYRIGAAGSLGLLASSSTIQTSAAPAGFFVYNTVDNAASPVNYESGILTWSSNVLSLGTQKSGTGVSRSFRFLYGNNIVADFNITQAGYWWFYDASANGVPASNIGVVASAYFSARSGSGNAQGFYCRVTTDSSDRFSLALDGSNNPFLSLGSGSGSTDVFLNRQAAGIFGIGQTSTGINGSLKVGDLYTNDVTYFIRTVATLTNGAAGNTATLTNAPTAGNPTKWIAIDDNGVKRQIPAW